MDFTRCLRFVTWDFRWMIVNNSCPFRHIILVAGKLEKLSYDLNLGVRDRVVRVAELESLFQLSGDCFYLGRTYLHRLLVKDYYVLIWHRYRLVNESDLSTKKFKSFNYCILLVTNHQLESFKLALNVEFFKANHHKHLHGIDVKKKKNLFVPKP